MTTRISFGRGASATETVIVSKCGNDQESSLWPIAAACVPARWCCVKKVRERHAVREMSESEPLVTHRNALGGIRTGVAPLLQEECGGNLPTGHAVPGV